MHAIYDDDPAILLSEMREHNKHLCIQGLRKIGKPCSMQEIAQEASLHYLQVAEVIERNKMTFFCENVHQTKIHAGKKKWTTGKVVSWHRDLLPYEVRDHGFKT